jgi:hypothetical protein
MLVLGHPVRRDPHHVETKMRIGKKVHRLELPDRLHSCGRIVQIFDRIVKETRCDFDYSPPH